jgi:hypothetical protein
MRTIYHLILVVVMVSVLNGSAKTNGDDLLENLLGKTFVTTTTDIASGKSYEFTIRTSNEVKKYLPHMAPAEKEEIGYLPCAINIPPTLEEDKKNKLEKTLDKITELAPANEDQGSICLRVINLSDDKGNPTEGFKLVYGYSGDHGMLNICIPGNLDILAMPGSEFPLVITGQNFTYLGDGNAEWEELWRIKATRVWQIKEGGNE